MSEDSKKVVDNNTDEISNKKESDNNKTEDVKNEEPLEAPMTWYYSENQEYASLNDDKNKPHSKFAILSKLIWLVILGVAAFYLIYNM